MLKICLVFWKSEPKYAYKRYAYKKNMHCLYMKIQNRQMNNEIRTILDFISNLRAAQASIPS